MCVCVFVCKYACSSTGLGTCVRNRQCEIKGCGHFSIFTSARPALSDFRCEKILSLLVSLRGKRKLLLDTVYDVGVHSGALTR